MEHQANDNNPTPTGINNPDYRRRATTQTLSWAMGRSYHEPTNNECCPDFSCCYPALFEHNADKRWTSYKRRVVSYERYVEGV